MQPDQAVDAPELGIGGLGGEAIIADHGPDDRPVLLLDVGAVVLLIGAAAGEGDPQPLAVLVEDAVDELRAVVAVEAEQGDRQLLAHVLDRAADPPLALPPDRVELDPAAGDVDGAEGVEVEALGARAAVGDQIDLEESGASVVPVREGPDRDLPLQPGADPGRGGGSGRIAGAGGGQHAAQRGGAGLAQELVDVGPQGQLAALEQPIEQLGDKRVQPLGA
ncbi:MAG: hypothetical protein ACREMB_12895, partial [Candidatus Rokuibacteriota bacterium]